MTGGRRQRRGPATYDVGYGKPPAEHRFKPGASGNPKGRPRGTRNLKTDLEDELKARVVVRVGERETHISRQQALVKRLVAKALGGDIRSAQVVLDLMQRLIEPDGTRTSHEAPLTGDETAVLDVLAQRLGLRSDEAENPDPSDENKE